jgi:hypothetical protein
MTNILYANELQKPANPSQATPQQQSQSNPPKPVDNPREQQK